VDCFLRETVSSSKNNSFATSTLSQSFNTIPPHVIHPSPFYHLSGMSLGTIYVVCILVTLSISLSPLHSPTASCDLDNQQSSYLPIRTFVHVRVSPSHTPGWVQTDSDRRDLKNILIVISSRTTLDSSWEASDW
jgi:hypothetical protein